ncbi:hypothetical protein [Carboxylicivirga linearis]|uniref:Lipoprotein n=1 Tax=Carboxylicivirga linearis TaxID=1628157 RepID=A0ABS5JXH2_9BACT|nr:hypothetical protein [Carboxylicivirga linearis]MBS2099612.1 hypothetical protein [Carboxylicivirga linearis]
MMKILYIIVFSFLIVSCDYQGTFTFKVKNETSYQIGLIFENENTYYSSTEEFNDTVFVKPNEEKTIRIIYAPLNSPAHDCLNVHGMTYFEELVFNTYIDGVKLEKQLWQPENWTYSSSSKWDATYSMAITEEMIQIKNNPTQHAANKAWLE